MPKRRYDGDTIFTAWESDNEEDDQHHGQSGFLEEQTQYCYLTRYSNEQCLYCKKPFFNKLQLYMHNTRHIYIHLTKQQFPNEISQNLVNTVNNHSSLVARHKAKSARKKHTTNICEFPAKGSRIPLKNDFKKDRVLPLQGHNVDYPLKKKENDLDGEIVNIKDNILRDLMTDCKVNLGENIPIPFHEEKDKVEEKTILTDITSNCTVNLKDFFKEIEIDPVEITVILEDSHTDSQKQDRDCVAEEKHGPYPSILKNAIDTTNKLNATTSHGNCENPDRNKKRVNFKCHEDDNVDHNLDTFNSTVDINKETVHQSTSVIIVGRNTNTVKATEEMSLKNIQDYEKIGGKEISVHYEELVRQLKKDAKCKLCPKKFDNRYGLIKHKASHYAVVIPSPSMYLKNTMPYLCSLCVRFFLYFNHYIDHMVRIHHLEAPLLFKECAECNSRYFDEYSHRYWYHHSEEFSRVLKQDKPLTESIAIEKNTHSLVENDLGVKTTKSIKNLSQTEIGEAIEFNVAKEKSKTVPKNKKSNSGKKKKCKSGEKKKRQTQGETSEDKTTNVAFEKCYYCKGDANLCDVNCLSIRQALMKSGISSYYCLPCFMKMQGFVKDVGTYASKGFKRRCIVCNCTGESFIVAIYKVECVLGI